MTKSQIYYQKNRKRMLETARRYRQTDRWKKYMKAYYKANREKILKWRRDRYKKLNF